MTTSALAGSLFVAIALLACRSRADEAAAAPEGQSSGGGRPATGFPRTGIAVADSAGSWCAAFAIDSTTPPLVTGRRVAIVFAGAAALPARPARIRGARITECPAAFAQSRWNDYTAYDLELLDSSATASALPSVALAVASDVAWLRGADGIVRADLDGDGQPEEARRCTADEGEHLTLWTRQPDGSRVRRWHEYYDWGGFTEPTCGAGEDGREAAVSDAASPRHPRPLGNLPTRGRSP